MSGLYVYAIAAKPLALRVRGIFGRPLRTVPAARLHAIVEPASRAPKKSLAKLRAQHRVLARLIAEDSPDILPVRFGTLVRDDEELARAIGERAGELTRALRAVKGCVQMTVRVPRHSETRGSRPPAPRQSGGAAYLRARAAAKKADASALRKDPVTRAIARAVKPHVRATRTEWRDGSAALFHLVPRAHVARYEAAISQAAARTHASLVVTGPWPPFAFAEMA